MTRYGWRSPSSTSYFTEAWVVGTHGNVTLVYLSSGEAVRPVFYLTTEVGLVGEGTEENPFIITSLANI